MRVFIISLMFVGFLFQGTFSAQAGSDGTNCIDDIKNLVAISPRLFTKNSRRKIERLSTEEKTQLLVKLQTIKLPSEIFVTDGDLEKINAALNHHSKDKWFCEMAATHFSQTRGNVLRQRYLKTAEEGDVVSLGVILNHALESL